MLRSVLLALSAAFLATAVFAADGLEAYVTAPDDAYAFEAVKTVPLGRAEARVLRLVSQTWQDTRWEHRLVVILPETIEHADWAALLVTGGSNREGYLDQMPSEGLLLAELAARTGTVIALLGQVPNQPLFGDLHEDALIAHSFRKFLETGDPTWPLLLPMTKSAVRAMDAVQAFVAAERGARPGKFLVTGASKRGWTTWLTGSVDPRVAGIAPMVIDVLDIPRQMRHQRASWGRYSEMIHDYADLGLLDLLTGPAARPLLDMVDPFARRAKIGMPKLVFLGTNDRYWPVDAARFYVFDLEGETHLHLVPNAGHGLDLSIVEPLTAFYRSLVTGAERPRLSWHTARADRRVRLVVTAGGEPAGAALWTARAPTRDFREARWSSAPMEKGKDAWIGRAELPAEGFVALYAAVAFRNGKGETLTVCTNVSVFPECTPKRD